MHQVADAGDVAANPFDIGAAVAAVEAAAAELLGRADHLVVIGGDHSLSLPLLRATAARHGPIALVHFDAHLDTWDTYFGAPYTHGTPFRRAVEEGLLDLGTSAHVGIRGPLYSTGDLAADRELGFATVTTMDVARSGPDAAVDRILERVGDRPVYVSVDIDVLDPAHAPGTGTPEPGGLTTRELQMILRGLDRHEPRRRRRRRGGAGVRPRRADDDRGGQRRLRAARPAGPTPPVRTPPSCVRLSWPRRAVWPR